MISLDVISPHRDDAALSLCQTLERVAAAGGDFRILSCFTVTAWAPRLAGNFTREEISELRRREDEAFVDQYNGAGTVCGLDFVDGPLRADWALQGRERVREAYGPDCDLAKSVGAALRMMRRRDSIMAVPFAVAHRDHVVCLWAGLAAAGDAPLLLYEDVPYSHQLSADELAAQVSAFGARVGRSFSPARIAAAFSSQRWIERLSCYASQFARHELAQLAQEIAVRGGERCWLSPGALAKLGKLCGPESGAGLSSVR